MSQESRTRPFDTAGVASAEEGHVVLDGPDGVAISLTAEAARATGQSLIEAAEQARSQKKQSPTP
jgi:hypothetical protein